MKATSYTPKLIPQVTATVETFVFPLHQGHYHTMLICGNWCHITNTNWSSGASDITVYPIPDSGSFSVYFISLIMLEINFYIPDQLI
jgi:hypothetical protein